MYKRNVTQVGPMKKFKTKREMFKHIAFTISVKLNTTKSVHQCENRLVCYNKSFIKYRYIFFL